MKILTIFALGGVLACSSAAWAETSIDAGKLGYMRGVLDTCSSVSPQKASDYLLQMKSLIGTASRDTVSSAIHSDEYQLAYQTIQSKIKDEMSNMPRADAAATCESYMTTN